MSNYSTFPQSIASSSHWASGSLLQLANYCYDNQSRMLIGGELTVCEYDRLYDSFMDLHQSSRCCIPSHFYGRRGEIQADIVEVIEDPELFVAMARDKKGSQFLQQSFPTDPEVCAFLYDYLLESDLLFTLTKDVFGNFVVQKMIEEAYDYGDQVFDYLKPHFYHMCKNRYSCRVAQKMISVYPARKVSELLNLIRGHEIELIVDTHASHVIQKIVTCVPPSCFAIIVNEITSSEKCLKDVIFDKYGCRVVQMCLDRLVVLCQKPSGKTSMALSLLNKMIHPIIKHAFAFSKDEFANYVIQFILTAEYLPEQRQRIIREVIFGNVLELSQERFASHVLEKALVVASPEDLESIVNEIFSIYQGDTLYIMLFDQLGNYVVQRLLEVLIEVKHGKRVGDSAWFDHLANRLIENEQNLLKYSSGKKILEVLEMETGPFVEYEKHRLD